MACHQALRSNLNVTFLCQYQVVRCTKYRRDVLRHIVATVGEAPLSCVKQYIENQKNG